MHPVFCVDDVRLDPKRASLSQRLSAKEGMVARLLAVEAVNACRRKG